MKNLKLNLIFFGILILSFTNLRSQISIGSTTVETRSVITNLDTPWEILWGPDNKIWFTERYGRISRVDPATGNLEVLITIADVYEESESGLLGMTLHPQFPSEPYVYVVYTYLSGSDIKERIARYTYNNNLLQNPVTLLEDIPGSGFHDGSRIIVGIDNKLYISTGDATNTSNSQNTGSVAGKILRMNLDGSFPADNPYTNNYLWSFGHRNPQGLVFTPDGKLYSSEHGPSNDDELNIIEKNRNYGWPDVNGFCNTQTEITTCTNWNVREPIAAWTPTLAVCGIDYYNHPSIPEWSNCILMANLKDKSLYSMKLSSDGLSITDTKIWFSNSYGRLRDICIAPDGRVFLATSNRDGRGSPVADDDKIIEIKPSGATALLRLSNPRIKIYPNPLQATSIIEVDKQLEQSVISVYNNLGTLIFKDKLNGTRYELSRNDIPKGFYIIKVEKNKQKFYQTLLSL
jgi:glucose/arabinose dehydrogenase